jgi:hypothetical protein
MPPYVPGRRKPVIAEVPQTVRNAIRVMYAGLAATLVDIVASLVILGRYVHNAATDQSYGRTAAAAAQNSMAGAMATGLLANFFGTVCWVWLAAATRRGRGWPRSAGTVLLGLYTVVMLFVVFGTKRDPSARFTTFVVWALGVAAVIPLWTRRAREFFFTWRRRR